MARAKQPVSVGGIEFDALLESEEGYEADVPEYPTEAGFNVTDAIILKADTLTMTIFVTDTPVTWRNRTGSYRGKTETVVKRLESLYFAKAPVEVITSDAVYTNMAISNLNIKKNGGGWLRPRDSDYIQENHGHGIGHNSDTRQLRKIWLNREIGWNSKHQGGEYNRFGGWL